MGIILESPIPEVYILWHPGCRIGKQLAEGIYAWLRPGNGVGPDVYYRSSPAPETVPKGLPLPLPGEQRAVGYSSKSHANLQIVLPLIDSHMVADAAWRYWLAGLGSVNQGPINRVFMPIALDSTAYNVPPPLRELNFLRPAGLSIAAEGESEIPLATVLRSLLKQLTEALCHVMLRRSKASTSVFNGVVNTDEAAPKINLFLSHAKADGTGPAKRIRDYIYGQTQLAAFYDENDIPMGSKFERVLRNGVLATGTAAFIAVRSLRYASRPWCRRELSWFRRPTRISSPLGVQQWRLDPVLIVDALEGGGLTQGIAELGNASIVRWSDAVFDHEEQIVTTIMRDVLLATFNTALGRAIPVQSNRIVLNWLPDPTTLLHIPSVRNKKKIQVVYPGRGFSGLELDIMYEFFPSIDFRSFEEVLS